MTKIILAGELLFTDVLRSRRTLQKRRTSLPVFAPDSPKILCADHQFSHTHYLSILLRDTFYFSNLARRCSSLIVNHL